MMDIEHAWRPRVLDPSMPADQDELQQRMQQPGIMIIDAFVPQLDDLLASRYPAMDRLAIEQIRRDALGDAPVWRLGRWVHYPWSNRLVHTLAPELFHEARLARNRGKITACEQARLAGRVVGIAGLSVGRQIARTLAMEGVCTGFRLADGDVLALSNLNRLPAGIADLGLPKVVLAARELFELDPFLDIQLFPDGLDAADLDPFLRCGASVVDLVIEECDDFAIKVRLRERARALGVPVLMETSERGTLDVERFDLEPARPLLHGLLEGVQPPGASAGVPDPAWAQAMVDHLLPHMRPRTRDAVRQVGRTLRSWPQLASEVALGAATVTTAARRILLGEPMASGRYLVDIDTTLDSGAQEQDRSSPIS
jgi:molybdopterin/thiamine biosynthesis adenylyltransferase